MSSKTAQKYGKQIVRLNRTLRSVKISLMKVSPLCQRELKQHWVDELTANFDPVKLGTPEVSHREGYYYIMDGQHRIEAAKAYLGNWEDQHLDCWVAEGLTEEEEAEVFLSLNDRKSVDVFQKFKVAVRAGRPAEVEISLIVKDESLTISTQTVPGAVRAVGTLLRVHRRNGPDTLRRALRLARDSYGDPGLDATIIDGFGLLCHRYNGVLDERSSVASLSRAHGGVNGLLGAAEQLRQKTGSAKTQCVAAAAVTIINRDRKSTKKLQPWFKN